jgi:hypothetical protein
LKWVTGIVDSLLVVLCLYVADSQRGLVLEVGVFVFLVPLDGLLEAVDALHEGGMRWVLRVDKLAEGAEWQRWQAWRVCF